MNRYARLSLLMSGIVLAALLGACERPADATAQPAAPPATTRKSAECIRTPPAEPMVPKLCLATLPAFLRIPSLRKTMVSFLSHVPETMLQPTEATRMKKSATSTQTSGLTT